MACSAKEAVIKARQEIHDFYRVKDVFDKGDMWHVSWAYPEPMAGGTPAYLVDKNTGEVIPFEPTFNDEHYALAKKYYGNKPIDRILWEE